MRDTPSPAHLDVARRVLQIEAQAVGELVDHLDDEFDLAVESVLSSTGRVIVCGMGKSGIIGRKIAATLSSTGTPSYFMHPGEAFHGDLGMVAPEDVFVAISNSGETEELLKLLPFLTENSNRLIAITGSPTSTLARRADHHLDVSVREEACPLQLAPTTSTTATLAMGDAFAVALMEAREFKPEQFARFHPGGALGTRLLSKVEDLMVATTLPILRPDAGLLDVLGSLTSSRLGLVIIEKNEGGVGVVTDGDIRRAIEKSGRDALDTTAADVMSHDPLSVAVGTRMEDAWALMDRHQVSSLLVVQQSEIVGVITK